VGLVYVITNVAYLNVLPFQGVEGGADVLARGIQHATQDRVGTAAMESMIGPVGATLMAVAILVSTFGCNNGLILAGARAYYAMARDGLFFQRAGRLNAARVPAWGLVLQGLWTGFLVLPRVFNPQTGAYGNLYGDLLEYVISAALIFYILTIAGIFRLRRTRPDAERPYRAFGYPVVPVLYILGAATILLVLFVYRPSTTWPGLAIVLLGLPVYLLRRPKAHPA
jgi:APA family basic amino acid/polyamine antiporter